MCELFPPNQEPNQEPLRLDWRFKAYYIYPSLAEIDFFQQNYYKWICVTKY